MMRKDKVEIKGYNGTWRVIDSKEYGGEMLYLLESEQHEDEPGLIVDEYGLIVLDDVYDGWFDFDEWRTGNMEMADAPTKQELQFAVEIKDGVVSKIGKSYIRTLQAKR